MGSRTWKESVLAVPGVGISILPKVVCPVCSPAYAAVLSSLGLGFLMSTAYLLPVTIIVLSVSLGSLAFRSARRRGLWPFWIGTAGAVSILVGKFWLNAPPLTVVGVAVLVFAAIWNAIPHHRNVCSCLRVDAGAAK